MIINVNLLEQELLTLPKHMTSPPGLSGVRGVLVIHFLVIHFLVIHFLVFAFLVPCSGVRYDFRVNMFGSSSLPFVL